MKRTVTVTSDTSLEDAVAAWERDYRRAAREDPHLEEVAQELKYFDRITMRVKRQAVRDTLGFVGQVASLLARPRFSEKGRRFLQRQSYHRRKSGGRYVLGFVDFDYANRWIVVDSISEFPLDLLCSMASTYSETCVEHVEVRRVDDQPLEKAERRSLCRAVRKGLGWEGRIPRDLLDWDPFEVRAYVAQYETERESGGARRRTGR